MLDTKNPLAPITVGSGFIITVNPANILNNGVSVYVPSTIVSLTPSATNFIFVNSSGTLTVNSSGFPAGCLPVASVICSSTSVIGVTDSRPDFYIPGGGSGAAATMFSPWGGMLSAAGANATPLTSANTIKLTGFYLPQSTSFTNIFLRVNTGDPANNYDWGIYDSSGSLRANVGAHTVNATGFTDLPISSGTATLGAGKYYFAFTGTAATVTLSSPGTAAFTLVTFLGPTDSVTPSSGGVLPATITVPADSWVSVVGTYAFTLHS